MEDVPILKFDPVPNFVGVKTAVFWDVDDFPLPRDLSLDSFIENLKHALKSEGHSVDDVKFVCYGEKKPDYLVEYADKKPDNLDLVTEREKYSRLQCMSVDMAFCALDKREISRLYPITMMVIAKNIKEETEFFRCIQELSCLGFKVLLALEDDASPPLLPVPKVNSLWIWKNLVAGGKPMDRRKAKEIFDASQPQRTTLSDDDLHQTCPLCVRLFNSKAIKSKNFYRRHQ